MPVASRQLAVEMSRYYLQLVGGMQEAEGLLEMESGEWRMET